MYFEDFAGMIKIGEDETDNAALRAKEGGLKVPASGKLYAVPFWGFYLE